jgi:hypothetical protein
MGRCFFVLIKAKKIFGDLQWISVQLRKKEIVINGFRGELSVIDIRWLDGDQG